MPQGGGAARSNGDFVSAAAGASGGLDTFYRYYVEVPAGSTKVQIDLWDADIGEGSASNEDDAGRDRNRGSWNTTATYRLFDPTGAARTPRFTTGDVNGVNDLWGATADNAWLPFYSATGNTVADNFNTAAFSNNTGTANWAANWIETDNDGAGVAAGSIRVTGNQLRIGDVNDSTPAPNIQREADLLGTPGLNMGMAYLTFSYSSQNLDGGGNADSIAVQVSANGGTSWTTLQTFVANVSGTASYDITPFIANNTRIRFVWVNGFTQSDEFFFVDNVLISDGTVIAGHWELQVDLSAGGDSINALGIRAHDGNSDGTGTEMNVYAHSMMELGVNPNNGASATRTYTHFPWITRGCTCRQNDFDLDDSGSTTYRSQQQCISGSCTAGTFTQSFDATTPMSGDNEWTPNTVTGFTTAGSTVGYGIWTKTDVISTYFNPGINGNYETLYVANSAAAANPPTSNPFANTFRIYMPADSSTAGTAVAPAKPYLEQQIGFKSGPSPLVVGQPTTFTVTVRLVNPTPHDITFGVAHSSGAAGVNVVTANIPGGTVLYGGNDSVTQGSVTSEPSVGGFGDIVWNPGTVAGGTIANPNVEILHYDVVVTPVDSSNNIATGLGSSTTTGTRAQYIDETGNTTQAASLNMLGPLCELSVQGSFATDVLVSSFDIDPRGGRTLVEWNTSSEAGTIGFNLYRVEGGQLTKVNDALLPASIGSAQGARYVFADPANASPNPQYMLEEVTASGRVSRHGPFQMSGRANIDWKGSAFERTPRGRSGRGALARSNQALNKAISTAIKTDLQVAADASKKIVAVMVGVSETGVVRVPAGSLATLFGTSESKMQKDIQKGDIAVTYRDSAVAWTAPADGSAVLFFGEKSDSIYANDRVYRIAMTGGTTMKSVSVAPASGAVSSYTAVKNVEQEFFPASALPLNPDADYWFWDFIISGDAGYGRKTFSIDATSLASTAAAQLEVRLQGVIDGNEHRASVSMNGVPLGEISWTNLNAKTATLTVPASVLQEGANEVAIEGASDAGDIFYIDGFTLRYSRFANAEGGALEMAAASGATVAGGFASAPMVLDVTSRLKPSLLQGAAFASGSASFVNPAAVKTLFFASTFVEPTFLRASAEASFSKSTRADYVAIAPAALRSDTAALADLRQRDGLATLVVDLNEIYDSYSGGNPTPFAIRDFISGSSKWSKAPRYFALVGAGSDDYRGYAGSPGVMPPFMVKTADGLYASDSRYADRNNDGLPEVAIGRIPVSSGAELRDYVRKLSSQSATTNRPMVFSADNTDGSVNFQRDSGLAEAPFGARPATRVYLDETGGSGGRMALLNAWNAGTPFVSWLGHGGLDQLSNAGILTAYDAPSLTSSNGTLPVMVAMTCTINRFEIGFVESLGAALTRTPDAGALAVWSASGLSVHNNAAELQRTFTRLAAQTPNARLGDLMVKSLATTADLGDTGSIYLLLGDPAIKLTLPAPPAVTPPTTRE